MHRRPRTAEMDAIYQSTSSQRRTERIQLAFHEQLFSEHGEKLYAEVEEDGAELGGGGGSGKDSRGCEFEHEERR
jgi:hypothetical protein